MTLSPIFRSDDAVRTLREEGIWDRLAPAARGQADAIARVRADLPQVLDRRFVDAAHPASEEELGIEFVQEFFFLILFRSVLDTLNVSPVDLRLCSELNFCIKGTITAADNLFDDQDKDLLHLTAGSGVRFKSILQLLAFERLTARALDRGIDAGSVSKSSASQLLRELLSRMAAIGALEGSEEGGVDGVLAPDRMIDQVHRVRGGALFELAFVAPRLLTTPVDAARLSCAQCAISKLGTAFQIVDDLTDFEVDLVRRSHNLLVSQIVHFGSAEEKSRLAALDSRRAGSSDIVISLFPSAGRALLERGEKEVSEALEELASIGFWFPPSLGPQLLRAIVGEDGAYRISTL